MPESVSRRVVVLGEDEVVGLAALVREALTADLPVWDKLRTALPEEEAVERMHLALLRCEALDRFGVTSNARLDAARAALDALTGEEQADD